MPKRTKSRVVVDEVRPAFVPPAVEDSDEKLKTIRIQNETVKAKRLVWEAAKEDAAVAKKDLEVAQEVLEKIIDESPQGELKFDRDTGEIASADE